MMSELPWDSIENCKVKFLGKPLSRLYKRHGVSRKGFALFLENPDGSGRKRLGADINLSVLILRCQQYADYPVKDIVRYYDEIHVMITKPDEKEET